VTEFLVATEEDALPMAFGEVEGIIGARLAPSARNYPQYWYSAQNSLGKAMPCRTGVI
jgi:hypothetical protein